MLQNLLVGVNGKEPSRAAVRLGVEWGRRFDVPITFLAVLDIDDLTAPQPEGMMGAGFKEERDAKVVENARARLGEALAEAARAAEGMGVQYEARLVEGGSLEVLLSELERHDLLIIGKKAKPKTDREPASTKMTEEVLRGAAGPVVVTGDESVSGSGVVVAHDGSPEAVRTFRSFLEAGFFADEPLHVVTITDDSAEGEATLARARDRVARAGRSAEFHVIPPAGSVTDTLVAFVERQKPALLVMGVYGQSRLKEMLRGSVSQGMLRRIPTPLFLDR